MIKCNLNMKYNFIMIILINLKLQRCREVECVLCKFLIELRRLIVKN